MEEHTVHLLRIDGTADVECEEFLKCLYDRIASASPEGNQPGEAAASRPALAPPGDIQPVPITGDFGLEVAHAQVDEFATACRQDWETLYQLVR